MSGFKMRMSVYIIIGAFFAAAHARAQGFDVDAAAASASPADRVEWHGYYEFEYWDIQDKNATFDAHKITIWLGAQLNDMARIVSEVEYEHLPRLPGDKAGGSGEIKIDSANLQLTPAEGYTGTFGAFYVPFGIEYYSYPGHKNKLVTRPKVMKSGGIIPGTWSDIGVDLSAALGPVGHLNAYYVNGDAYNGGISRDSSTGGNKGKTAGARLMLDTLVDGFNVGGSYASGKWDVDDKYTSTRWGAHLRADGDKISGVEIMPVLLAEYVTGKDEAASSAEGEDKEVSGYYVQLSSRILPAVELAARYGVYDNDKKKKDNEKSETSVGLVWHMLPYVQAKAEYQWNGEQGAEKENNAAVVQLVADW
ncbi:MAG: hypothetical protein HY804_14170 [Nitrospinae bacterium]|nr:hypothetical protein [Nitrospinota bacterium]